MEIWKDIKEYGNKYQVSNNGRIRNKKTKYIKKPRVINSGYLIIDFPGNPYPIKKLVHRIVAQYFCEWYDDKLVINHKDGNRLNNHADNLEWVTQKQNIKDSIKRGTHNISKAQNIAKEKNKKLVAQYTMEGELVAIYESAKMASDIIGTRISRAASGERKSAGGYIWRYIG